LSKLTEEVQARSKDKPEEVSRIVVAERQTTGELSNLDTRWT